jgi:hypothetical protein
MDIKRCIAQKYPHYSERKSALLFASTVYKIVDKNIIHFDPNTQAEIKKNLLKEVVKKEVFDINAYDIFTACIALNLSDENFIDNLTAWMNHNQPICFSKSQVSQLTLELKNPNMSASPTLLHEETPVISETKAHFLSTLLSTLTRYQRIVPVAVATMLGLFVLYSVLYHESIRHEESISSHLVSIPDTKNDRLETDVHLKVKEESNNTLHRDLQYKEINTEALNMWLSEKNSMLAEEPYFNSIILAAKEHNINPLLMFAITGQEQSFVPRSNAKASSIANNPFNVYGSWIKYNTDIADTSRIAARTIVNLGKDCPESENPVKWINKKYAEDPNWHLGVSQILSELEETAGK